MAWTEPTNFINISGNKVNPNSTTNKIHIAPADIKGCCDGSACTAQFKAEVKVGDIIITPLPILNGNTSVGVKYTITDGKGGVYSGVISGASVTLSIAGTLASYLDTNQPLTIWLSINTDAGECKGKLDLTTATNAVYYSQNYQCPLGVIVKANIVDAGADITVTVTNLVKESGGNNSVVSWTVKYWKPGDDPATDAATGTITNLTSSPLTISAAANGDWIFLITEYVLVGNNCTETLNPANYANYNSLQKAVHTQS